MKARQKLTKQQHPLKPIQISGYSCDSLLNENPMKSNSPNTSQPPRSDFFSRGFVRLAGPSGFRG